MNQSKNKFNFFVPIEFAKGSTPGKEMWIKGVASTVAEDSDGETLHPTGFNLKPLLESGFLNYNHQASKTAAAIIGEPTKAEIVNGGKDLYIEGYLYADSPEAKAVYKLAQTLEKNSSTRRLGFSIEGIATSRDPFNDKKVLTADITSVAITPCPKNPNTLLSIMKGDYSKPLIAEEEEDEDEDVKKAMSVGGAFAPLVAESVDANIIVEPSFGKVLKKSEVYQQIVKSYPTASFDQVKNIYSFIQSVNSKITNNMDQILEKGLQASFNLLDSQIDLLKSKDAETNALTTENADDLSKGEVSNIETNKNNGGEIGAVSVSNNTTLSEQDDKKDSGTDAVQALAKSLAADALEKGLTQEEAVKTVTGSGIALSVAQMAVAACISSAEGLEANGGDITVVTAGNQDGSSIALQKSEEATQLNEVTSDNLSELIKSKIEETNELIKSQTEAFGERFRSVGKIMKSVSENQELFSKSMETIKKENDDLKKSLESISIEVEKIRDTPLPAKSVLTKSHVERFEKSKDSGNGTNVSLNNRGQMNQLNDMLFNRWDGMMKNNNKDANLEKAIQTIELAGTLDNEGVMSIAPHLNALGINITE